MKKILIGVALIGVMMLQGCGLFVQEESKYSFDVWTRTPGVAHTAVLNGTSYILPAKVAGDSITGTSAVKIYADVKEKGVYKLTQPSVQQPDNSWLLNY